MEKALWFIGMQPKIKASNTCLTTKIKRLGEKPYLLIFLCENWSFKGLDCAIAATDMLDTRNSN